VVYTHVRAYIHRHTHTHTHTHIRARTVGYCSVIITLTKKRMNYTVITHSSLCKIFLFINTAVYSTFCVCRLAVVIYGMLYYRADDPVSFAMEYDGNDVTFELYRCSSASLRMK
jgi:hypothetical protein